MSAGYFSDLTWAAEDVEQILTQNEIQNGFALLRQARLLAIPKSDGTVFLHWSKNCKHARFRLFPRLVQMSMIYVPPFASNHAHEWR